MEEGVAVSDTLRLIVVHLLAILEFRISILMNIHTARASAHRLSHSFIHMNDYKGT